MEIHVRRRPSRATVGVIAVAAAAALWAVAASVAGALFRAGVMPLELAAARAVVTATGLAFVGAAWRPRQRTAHGGVVVALGLTIALVNGAYYLAIDHLGVAVAVVLQYTAPALVVAWTAVVLRRAPSSSLVAALAAALLGVVLVSELAGGDLGDVDAVGIGLGLTSAALFATYTLLSETAASIYGPVAAIFRAFVVASAFWIVYLLFNGWPAQLFVVDNLVEVVFVGVAGTLLPFLLFVWGVQRVRAERAAVAATLEPVVAAAVAWVWLGQALSPVQVAGGVLVLGAVLLLSVSTTAGAATVGASER